MRCFLMCYLVATAIALNPFPLRASLTNARVTNLCALPGTFIGAPLRRASGISQRSVQTAKRAGAMTMGLFGLGVPEIAVILAMGNFCFPLTGTFSLTHQHHLWWVPSRAISSGCYFGSSETRRDGEGSRQGKRVSDSAMQAISNHKWVELIMLVPGGGRIERCPQRIPRGSFGVKQVGVGCCAERATEEWEVGESFRMLKNKNIKAALEGLTAAWIGRSSTPKWIAWLTRCLSTGIESWRGRDCPEEVCRNREKLTNRVSLHCQMRATCVVCYSR